MKDWNRDIPTTAAEVIELLERRIAVHAEWLDWMQRGPKTETQKAEEAGVGTSISHQTYIDQYRGAIAVIRQQAALMEECRPYLLACPVEGASNLYARMVLNRKP